MREDMAKVIVERPRLGGAGPKPKGYRRRLRRYGEDGPPGREGIRARWPDRKGLNEHLGPLRRYLDSQVGRPWDKVFSEICARIDRNSAVQDHVRDHVEQYVLRHVILVDGVPCYGDGGRLHGHPLRQYRGRGWYVCPKTGLLRRVPLEPRLPKRHSRRTKPPAYVRVSDTLQCRYIDGGWHLVVLKPLPEPYYNRERCLEADVLLDKPVAKLTSVEARQQYGGDVYAATVRRLSRREQRQYPIPVEFWI
jgi:hypothetical protein